MVKNKTCDFIYLLITCDLPRDNLLVDCDLLI